jgi:RNA polymerase sigma factor (sigma-70 family)
MATDLIDRAQAGDGQAFSQLVEPYRRELQVHCYRILGSAQDAEDAMQETLLAAWRGLGGFEQRSSLRTWLYRIATTRSLNALRSASRRPAMEWSNRDVDPPGHAGEGAQGLRMVRPQQAGRLGVQPPALRVAAEHAAFFE